MPLGVVRHGSGGTHGACPFPRRLILNAVSSPFDLIFWSDKVYVNVGRAKHLLRLEDVKFAHQIDQRLRRTLITLQGLALRSGKDTLRSLRSFPCILIVTGCNSAATRSGAGLAPRGRPLGLREGSPFLNWCSRGGRP
jgi:hypothetical protein